MSQTARCRTSTAVHRLSARAAGPHLRAARSDSTARRRFQRDRWQRAEGGGGESRVLRDGAVFEQAGVNFSHVMGAKLPPCATAQRPELAGAQWIATGRIARHSSAQSATSRRRTPTCASSSRTSRTTAPAWWFGGGFDLTPYYPFDEDVLHWHRTAQQACAPFGADVYARSQGLVRSLFLSQASQRDARRRRPVLRRSERMGL